MALTRAATKYGVAVGKTLDSGCCSSFKGIPYAQAERFSAPRDPEAWEGEKLFSEFGLSPIASMRGPGGNNPQGEDCLNLNIWTPAESPEEKLPVMFWIFGGGFQGGSAADPEFDGEALTGKGVVVVTVNYRLGALGFLALKELETRDGHTGNYGLLDQIAALKWVHENIAAFGGDPDRVLIHGQSAGGISVRMLLCSPLAKGLFARAVVQSGGGLNEADPVRPAAELMEIGRKSMELAGLTFEQLLTEDADMVNSKLCAVATEAAGFFAPGIFQPCIDHYVLNDVPGASIARGEYNTGVDILVGTVCGDSDMFCRPVKEQIGENDPMLRGVSYTPSQSFARAAEATGNRPIHTYYMERTQPPRERPMGPQSRPGEPPRRPIPGFGGYRYGLQCPHSSEIAYVFGVLEKKSPKFTDYDREISELLMTAWTNFARTGDPNGEGVPEWPACTSEHPVTLHISDSGVTVENVVDSDAAERFIGYTMRHPGFLMAFEEPGIC